MASENSTDGRSSRTSALDMSPAEFREAGHELIEQIADFYESLPERPLTLAETPSQVRELIGTGVKASKPKAGKWARLVSWFPSLF